jgi:predicted protein tyrosine phosphatase
LGLPGLERADKSLVSTTTGRSGGEFAIMVEQKSAPASMRRASLSQWPWLVLLLTVVPAVWHIVDFPNDVDGEFPMVARPTFSHRPPPAYRLAEPGDTIDRVALYVSAGALVIALVGWGASRGVGRGDRLWPVAVLLSVAAVWHASTPSPTFDRWHGLGWRTIFDASGPLSARLPIAVGALALAACCLHFGLRLRKEWLALVNVCRVRRASILLGSAIILVALRQVEFAGVEPAGYWPRWCFVWGVLAFGLALIRLLPPLPPRRFDRSAIAIAAVAAWYGIVVGGIALAWWHRPLARLRAVEPGKIYISAMPTYRGLKVAHDRHHFKTIINLFPEETAQRSPILGDELRFVREHNIRYLRAPTSALASDAFLDRTLELARDPEAWPILVHCHGCMDRSPAWMGIYKFLIQGRPLGEIMTEIERHRGYRPKASVTLLYNRVLAARAPERYASDPTAALLRRCALGTVDPYYAQVEAEAKSANQSSGASVSR